MNTIKDFVTIVSYTFSVNSHRCNGTWNGRISVPNKTENVNLSVLVG